MLNNTILLAYKACCTLPMLLLLTGLTPLWAQFQPVQVTPQLVPPYSVYLSDYATPGNEKLRLVVLQRDRTKPAYQIRLRMSVELNGKLILRTSSSFNPAPITLDPPGLPIPITGTDLQQYVDSRNLEFIGVSRQEYERTKALPEGNYQICFTAFDYYRPDVPVSETSCAFFWLAKSEPPLINFPACGTALPIQNPQQINFSWLPRNTSSPASVNDTRYEFSLYETRPAGRNPNDVVLSSQPVYTTTTSLTQILYGPAEPVLLQDMTYVWRVRAIDTNGKDAFRNQGYSEVCTFSYGGAVSAVELQPVEGLQAEGETERRGKAWWQTQPDVDQYKVHYKKVGSGYKWFSEVTERDSLSFFDLEPDTEYELRVQAITGASYGPYSDIRQFKTLPKRIYQCGDEVPPVPPRGAPLPFATVGMIIDVQGIEMAIKEVDGPFGEGLYKGKGEVSIPYFGGAVFNVVFDNLYIDDTRTAAAGRIDFVTKGVEQWIEDELEKQRLAKLAEQQQKNRDEWKGTDFYDKIFYYEDIIISEMSVNEHGEVIITDAEGNVYVNKEIPTILTDAPEKAIIIEDKNGDQWVVQKDGKVTKVPGGGLSPTQDVVVTEEAVDFVMNALAGLYDYYDESRVDGLKHEKEIRQKALDEYIDARNRETLGIDEESPEQTPEADEEMEPLLFDFEPIETIGAVDETFERLFNEAIDKEMEHNRALLIRLLGKPENIGQGSTLIAPELLIDELRISEYIAREKSAGSSLDQLLQNIKGGIETLLNKVLRSAASGKTDNE